MTTMRDLIFLAMTVAATASTAYAGPCSNQIDAMQVRIDARLEAKAAAGPSAKQGVAAGMSVQPTPRSIAAAEEKLGDISPQVVEELGQAMARARAADTAGDNGACQQALADAQRAIGP